MDYPERPICHDNDTTAQRFGETKWRERDGHRHCSYCGSLHPEDLLNVLNAGASLGGADWKYGWPHKFYIRQDKFNAKWYNEHLLDLAPETQTMIIELLELHAGIKFTVTGQDIGYQAPHHNYQR